MRAESGGDSLIQRAQRVAAGHREATLVAWALGVFVVLWMLYDTVSSATVTLRWDASEASLWAQHFAFGYKHPPMTAWLFMLWFAVFPHTDWAAHLQDVAVVAVTLAITWRLLRDHLDRNRALFGVAALMLVPLYTFKTAELNANSVMMPFWAATLLFYLRARRGLGLLDLVLAGAFASLTVLGKYWAVYLLAGMAVASVVGADTRRFWRSLSPYLMAAGAAIVIAPHLYWYIAEAGGSNYAFIRDSVMSGDTFSAALGRSAYYLVGALAFVIGPLALLAALRPDRTALADIARAVDPDRQQAMVLLVVPLLLPPLVNLILPYRLTPDWTFPNWALLPIVLYGSRRLAVDARAVAAAGLVTLALSLAFVIVSPLIAYERLSAGMDPNRPASRHVAAVAERLGADPAQLYWGSPDIVDGLPFYLPGSRPLEADPLSKDGRAAIATRGLLIACLDSDAPCQAVNAALAGAGNRSADVTFRHTFLGFVGPAIKYRVAMVPARPD